MEKRNITSGSKDHVAKILSNLASTPFEYGGYQFDCVEAALQGIKYANKEEREAVFGMKGMSALKAGRKITNNIQDGEERFVYWNNQQLLYNSDEHRLLIASFIREKFRQNKSARKALMGTKKDFLYHDVGPEHPKTSLPEKLFIEILLAERKVLLKILSLQ